MSIYADQLSPGWQDWSWDADLDLGATDQVYRGARAIRITLRPYGALSLWHAAFSTSGYEWLEFYIRGPAAAEPDLEAFLWNEHGTALRRRWVNDCRYVEGERIGADAWKRVIVPMVHLDAEGRSVSQITLQDRSGRAFTTFWVDEVRLVEQEPPPGLGSLVARQSPSALVRTH